MQTAKLVEDSSICQVEMHLFFVQEYLNLKIVSDTLFYYKNSKIFQIQSFQF